jgi:hypothetical protein
MVMQVAVLDRVARRAEQMVLAPIQVAVVTQTSLVSDKRVVNRVQEKGMAQHQAAKAATENWLLPTQPQPLLLERIPFMLEHIRHE